MDEVNYKKEKENNDYTSNRYENYINRNVNDNKIENNLENNDKKEKLQKGKAISFEITS